jgi:AbrB family looped-hinge helix DNA binding protein
MTKIVFVSDRGTLTLPKEVRDKLGVTRGGEVLLDMDEGGGVTIRSGVVLPVEIYSTKRIEEFQRMNELPLAAKKLRWRKGR